MKLSEKIQEALREQQEINLSDPAVQKRLAAQWGYVPAEAQPAPRVPDGWLRAIDEALVTAHIGVANAHDTYEQAKAKLDNLLRFHVDVATDPAVNGGWKLVPIEPTREMIQKACSDHGYPCGDCSVYARGYRTMLAAAPEAKP